MQKTRQKTYSTKVKFVGDRMIDMNGDKMVSFCKLVE